MGRRISILSVAAAGFAAATAVAGSLAAAQLFFGSGAPQLLPLAQPHIDRAGELLSGPRGTSPKALDAAEAEARRALAVSPARADAWLTVAYVEQVRARGLSAKALEALARSYEVGPLDPDVSMWRLQFGFENWGALPKELRTDALREYAALWSRTERRQPLRQLADKIGDPTGALAFRVQLAMLEREAQAEEQARLLDQAQQAE